MERQRETFEESQIQGQLGMSEQESDNALGCLVEMYYCIYWAI